MRPSKRHREILDLVRDKGTCQVADLAAHFGVSFETIRRDVKPLTSEGLLSKAHGAVFLPDRLGEAPFERRMRDQADEKKSIARALARRIRDGDSLILDTGTTTSYLARALLDHRSLTVVTNSSDVARTLATVNGNKVYMAGGKLRGDNGAAFGPAAIEFIGRFRALYAVVSIGAIDADAGFMDYGLAESELARKALQCGETKVVVSDHTKFGRRSLVTVAPFDEIDLLVTDREPPDDISDCLNRAGTELLISA
ncbi:MAG: DeoR/GlpR family DNA-binding transcription regulator [Kiloniellales bacterium]|nr:DeoR/GlpR family DNA-binding transcription regulator [Kiloniellales bacterium]